MPELWDAYDNRMNLIPDVTLIRDEPIPEGMYHIVVDILVKHKDGEYLLMKRDPRKANGGMWEASAGGSALKGEDPLTAAKRELREETGITDGKMTEVGRILSPLLNVYYVSYLFETEQEKSHIIFQEGETVGYKWVSEDEFLTIPHSQLLTERMQILIPELGRRRRELC